MFFRNAIHHRFSFAQNNCVWQEDPFVSTLMSKWQGGLNTCYDRGGFSPVIKHWSPRWETGRGGTFVVSVVGCSPPPPCPHDADSRVFARFPFKIPNQANCFILCSPRCWPVAGGRTARWAPGRCALISQGRWGFLGKF